MRKGQTNMEVKLISESGLSLWVGPNEQVQIPMCKKERAECRKALLDALNLLDETIVKYRTLSTADETGAPLIQSLPHLDGCLGVFDYSHPSEQPTGNAKRHLRIVSSDRQ